MTRHDMTRQGNAKQGNARQDKVMQSKEGKVMQDHAGRRDLRAASLPKA
jgi:hypothetical protein